MHQGERIAAARHAPPRQARRADRVHRRGEARSAKLSRFFASGRRLQRQAALRRAGGAGEGGGGRLGYLVLSAAKGGAAFRFWPCAIKRLAQLQHSCRARAATWDIS